MDNEEQDPLESDFNPHVDEDLDYPLDDDLPLDGEDDLTEGFRFEEDKQEEL